MNEQHTSGFRNQNHVPDQKIRRVYSQLVHKFRANEVAAQMYENKTLQITELNDIQDKYSRNDVKAAEILLNIVLARPPRVYESFLQALETNNQFDAYRLLADDEYVLPSEHLHKIQSNYAYLLRELDTLHSGLLDRLVNDDVLKLHEKMQVDVLTLPHKRCEKLLSILRRKTQKEYELFLQALDATNQSHIAYVLKLEGTDGTYLTLWSTLDEAGDQQPPPTPCKPKACPTLPISPSGLKQAEAERSSPIIATLTEQRSTDSAVRGIALLGNFLYVLHMRSCNQLDELDMHNLQIQRHLPVPVQSPRPLTDMASCQRRRRLFISHDATDCVHVLALTVGEIWSKWKTRGSPWGLSVTQDTGNLLVTLRYERRVDEYSPEGLLLRSIDLHRSGAFSPWHAVQTSSLSKMLLVGHGDRADDAVRVGFVRILDSDDTVEQRWYGGRPGDSKELLSRPQQIAIGLDGTLAVADVFNDRVVLLDNELRHVGVVGVSASHRAEGRQVSRICYIGHRLCIAESQLVKGKFTTGRLTVYELCFEH